MTATPPKPITDFKFLAVKSSAPIILDMNKADVFNRFEMIFSKPIQYYLSGSRKKEIILFKHFICWILYNKTELTFEQIAKEVRLTNHTSIMHAVSKVNGYIEIEDEYVMDLFNRWNGGYG